MDRNVVYPGAIPLDTDLLNVQRSVMKALGFLMQATLGTNAIVDGLTCTQTSVPSMAVVIGPGSITTAATVDGAFGSLSADTNNLMKMGVNETSVTLSGITAPSSGNSQYYLVQASFSEIAGTPVTLPYYNAANPAAPYSGPANTGAAQNTIVTQSVSLSLVAGAASATPTVPATSGGGYIALYTILVTSSTTSITSANIAQVPGAPFVYNKLPTLRPGFASGVQTYTNHGTYSWTVPNGVTQVEAEVWGAGSGSWASTSSISGGGGAGGGYSRKRITGLTPGATITVTVGQGGAAGTTAPLAPTAGTSSSLGSYCSATGGQINGTSSTSNPANGNLGGVGSGGDVNLYGGDGGQANGVVGGAGGDGPMSGGVINSGTIGRNGYAPGGGGSGAGCPISTAYNGGAGADGAVVIRW